MAAKKPQSKLASKSTPKAAPKASLKAGPKPTSKTAPRAAGKAKVSGSKVASVKGAAVKGTVVKGTVVKGTGELVAKVANTASALVARSLGVGMSSKKVAAKTVKAAKAAKVAAPAKAKKELAPKKAAKAPLKAAAPKAGKEEKKSAAPAAGVAKAEAKGAALVSKGAAVAKGAGKGKRLNSPVAKVKDKGQDPTLCREVACDSSNTTAGFCRLHYIKNWKKIKRKETILKEGRLVEYIEELVRKYPEKYIEAIRADLSSDKEFSKVVHDLELDEGIEDFEGDAEGVEGVIDTIKRGEIDDDAEAF